MSTATMQQTKESYEIVKYTPEFRKQVLELQHHHWGLDDAMNEAYFTWKYDENPYLDGKIIPLALHNGKVVGMRGVYGSKWEYGDPAQSFMGGCTGDMVIHPDHRSKGLMTKMNQLAMNELAGRGYDYIFNLSAGEINFFTSLATGWRSIGSLKMIGWEYKPEVRFQGLRQLVKRLPMASKIYWRMRKKKRRKMIGAKAQTVNAFQRFDRRIRETQGQTVMADDSPRPEEMAALIEHLPRDKRIHHARDEAFFSWRYRAPLGRYRFLYYDDGGLKGYMVLHSSRRKSPYMVNIIDWKGINANVRGELLGKALEWGHFFRLEIWSGTLPEDSKVLLEQKGFAPVEDKRIVVLSRPTVLMKSVHEGVAPEQWSLGHLSMLKKKNWDLFMADSDCC